MNQFSNATPELSSFLVSCHQENEEATSSLVLADYLEDKGDPRADMIRASVQLANHHPGEIEWHDAKDILDDWQENHLKNWLGRAHGIHASIHRGLLQLEMSASLMRGRSLSKKIRETLEQGWVQSLLLTGVQSGQLGEIAGLNRFGQLSRLHFNYRDVTQNDIQELIKALPGLREIHVKRHQSVPDEVLEPLLRLPLLEKITWVMPWNNPSRGWLEAILTLEHLRELTLNVSTVFAEKEISSMGRFSKLQQFRVSGSEEMVNQFLNHLGQWPMLEELSLVYTNGVIQKDHIEKISGLPGLRKLILINIRSQGCGEFGQLASMPNLTSLNLGLCDGFDQVAHFPEISQLEELDLIGTRPLNTTLLDSLAQFKQLKRLNLSHRPVGNDSLRFLIPLQRLENLEMQYCSALSMEGANALAELPQLRRVNLFNTTISGETLLALQRCKALRELILSNRLRLKDELHAFKDALPNCRVRFLK